MGEVCILTLWMYNLVSVTGNLDNQPNLAWELVTSFARIWNRTDQGFCVDPQTSTGAGFRFTLIWLNVTKVLGTQLQTASCNCTRNCAWGEVTSPFEDQPRGKLHKNGTWRTNMPFVTSHSKTIVRPICGIKHVTSGHEQPRCC